MTPYYEDDLVTIYHGDAMDVLPTLKTADIAIADPPYTFGLASTKYESAAGSWGDLMNNAHWYAAWLLELRRIVKGSAWVFNTWRSFPVLARAGFQAGWPIDSLLVWDKGNNGPGDMGRLRNTYELVAQFSAPDFAFVRGNRDIWTVPRIQSATKDRQHPAEKPVSLLRRLIDETGARSLVDPFTGSGSSLVAAKAAGIRAVGIEIEERYCHVAAERCSQEALGLSFLPLTAASSAVSEPLPIGEDAA